MERTYAHVDPDVAMGAVWPWIANMVLCPAITLAKRNG